ncbi:hypothetical protein [Olleya sp. HaHaR_3_96]|uniref:hypothetical protein n=1 Tax=Olleya sp. HaHaR_3_96 TaxID=2745560 RepID=UPI001C4FCB17|nr:hypothetical protein [Olleya sp. HaHaR_3_96]QXP60844.1 hypothetical protein H0I26_04185 [Olleya sp. HaHaR_3_96]
MKYTLNIVLLIVMVISCKNQSNSKLNQPKVKTDLTLVQKTELKTTPQTQSIPELWHTMVFEKRGCLGSGQYYKLPKRNIPTLVFSETEWGNFSNNDKGELTEFLITKFSDTTTTKVHTCPFFATTNGEMAVYALQHILKKNWYDFSEFKKYKAMGYKSATEQPQIWLQNILKNEADRTILVALFKKELKE